LDTHCWRNPWLDADEIMSREWRLEIEEQEIADPIYGKCRLTLVNHTLPFKHSYS
jgi:hypothetical protein